MLLRLLPQDVPLVDKNGRIVPDWYDKLKILEPSAKTVATLPAVGNAGARDFVSDATATTFNSIVAGGGTNGVPVFDDGAHWRIG